MQERYIGERDVAIISGASSGIGEAFAHELGANYHLILVARRKERLDKLVATLPSAIAYQCDLSLRQDRESFIGFCKNYLTSCKILINNAGYGHVGEFKDDSLEKELNMVEVNCLAPLHLTHGLIGLLKGGTIINVASIAAFQPMPYMSTYAASKSFLLSHSVSLAEELAPAGIRVIALCPGPVPTEFHIVAGLSNRIPYLHSQSAKEVVNYTLKCVRDGHSPIIVPGIINKLIRILVAFLPFSWVAKIVKILLKSYA
jgi:short-subunit dehydrogenase